MNGAWCNSRRSAGRKSAQARSPRPARRDPPAGARGARVPQRRAGGPRGGLPADAGDRRTPRPPVRSSPRRPSGSSRPTSCGTTASRRPPSPCSCARDITGVDVPESSFVQTRDLASARSMVPIWERINGTAASGGGAHPPPGCTAPGSSRSAPLPGGQTLSESTENTIEASTDLAFTVAVANTGDNQDGATRGDPDDPAEPDPDREEADDPGDQRRRDEVRRLPRLPVGRLRRETDVADRRRAGAEGEETRRTTRPSTRSSSRSEGDGPARLRLAPAGETMFPPRAPFFTLRETPKFPPPKAHGRTAR